LPATRGPRGKRKKKTIFGGTDKHQKEKIQKEGTCVTPTPLTMGKKKVSKNLQAKGGKKRGHEPRLCFFKGCGQRVTPKKKKKTKMLGGGGGGGGCPTQVKRGGEIKEGKAKGFEEKKKKGDPPPRSGGGGKTTKAKRSLREKIRGFQGEPGIYKMGRKVQGGELKKKYRKKKKNPKKGKKKRGGLSKKEKLLSRQTPPQTPKS